SARTRFLSEVGRNLEAARKLRTPGLVVLSDAVDARGIPIPPSSNLSRSQKIENLYENLQAAVPLAEAANTVLLLEPLNSQIDHPGFTLDSSGDAFAIVRDLGSRSLKVLFDVYHMQIMEGNIVATIEKNLELIGHIHIADVPGRHE